MTTKNTQLYFYGSHVLNHLKFFLHLFHTSFQGSVTFTFHFSTFSITKYAPKSSKLKGKKCISIGFMLSCQMPIFKKKNNLPLKSPPTLLCFFPLQLIQHQYFIFTYWISPVYSKSISIIALTKIVI